MWQYPPETFIYTHRKMTLISCSTLRTTLWLLLLLSRLLCTQRFVSDAGRITVTSRHASARLWMNRRLFLFCLLCRQTGKRLSAKFVCTKTVELLRPILLYFTFPRAQRPYLVTRAIPAFSLLKFPPHHRFMQMRHLLSLELMPQQKLTFSVYLINIQ